MLAGLIFTTDDADDWPDTIAAVRPFAGTTLIEHQARLMMEAGAKELVIVVSRVSPALLAAVNRIGRRGVSVDLARTAPEAASQIHPLAVVLVFGSGLVTTAGVLDLLPDTGETMLVLESAAATSHFDRVDARTAWAGIARFEARRLAEVAALPDDWNFQSTLLRQLVQAGAAQRAIPPSLIASAVYGEVRDPKLLDSHWRGLYGGAAARGSGWVSRWVSGPIASRLLQWLIDRNVSDSALPLASIFVVMLVVALLVLGFPGAGLFAIIIVTMLLDALGMRGRVTGRRTAEQIAIQSAMVVQILGLAFCAWIAFRDGGGLLAPVLALVALGLTFLAERATGRFTSAVWVLHPPGFAIVLLPFVFAGQVLAGLFALALYAAASLSAAIERIREKP